MVSSVNSPAGDLIYVHVLSAASWLMTALSLEMLDVCNTSSVPANFVIPVTTLSPSRYEK